jgi:chemotaxis protein MotA
MLSDMSDPENIGPAMAVALLTTFYGAVIANLIFIPMVTKLDRRIQIEVTQIQLAIVGFEAMMKGESTQILREKLKAFMNQTEAKAEAALQPAA